MACNGLHLYRAFEETGDHSHLTRAIEVYRRVISLTCEGHACLPVRLNSLGLACIRLFDYTGNLSDIAEAISTLQRAVQLTPDGSTEMPIRLSNLGCAFSARSQRTGSLSDISESISTLRRVVHLTPDGHSNFRSVLNNLGIACMGRFNRTRDPLDFAEAISSLQKVVHITPEGHSGLPPALTNIGIAFSDLFKCSGDLSDISKSISFLQKAVRLSPEECPDLPKRLNGLGNSLRSRFGLTGDLSDITETILVQKRAVHLTPERHSDLPGTVSNLGRSFEDLFNRTGHPEHLIESIANLKSSATSKFGDPRARQCAAVNWIRLAGKHRSHVHDVLPAFGIAVRLVAVIAGLERTVQGRYEQLHKVVGLLPSAAAAACSFDQAEQALEWLEQGRCLVWNQLHNLRTPLDELRIQNSQLAQSIEDISKQLQDAGLSRVVSHVGMSLSEKALVEDATCTHAKLASRWEDLLRTVRAIPGFETFLQPSPCSVLLRNLPVSGPIVVINVDPLRCDAIALVAGLDEPIHIPLPEFSWIEAQGYRRDLSTVLQNPRLRRRDLWSADDGPSKRVAGPYRRKGSDHVVRDILGGLWTKVVKPILEILGFPVSSSSLVVISVLKAIIEA